MTTGTSKKLIVGVSATLILLGTISAQSTFAASLSIIDADGYISPKAQAQAEANASVSNTDNNTLLTANGEALIEATVGSSSASTSTEEYEGFEYAGTQQENTGISSTYNASSTNGFFARLQSWGRLLLDFFSFDSSTSASVQSSLATTPVVETTPTTAHIAWSETPSLVARVYYDTSGSVEISSTTSSITTWGMSKQEVELDNLSANTTYYYRIVPLGLTSSAPSPVYSFTTGAAATLESQ